MCDKHVRGGGKQVSVVIDTVGQPMEANTQIDECGCGRWMLTSLVKDEPHGIAEMEMTALQAVKAFGVPLAFGELKVIRAKITGQNWLVAHYEGEE